MAVTIAEITRRYPRLYHMAAGGSWPSIRYHGLLSTSSLLDLFEVGGEERTMIESRRRPATVTIAHSRHGVASIRDQKVLSETKLRRVLQGGITSEEWFRLLNSKVFFWVSEARLNVLLGARAYRATERLILELDSFALLTAYEEQVLLCAMNSGNTSPFAHPRGPDTFARPAAYPYEHREKKKQEPVVEVVIEGGIPDVERFVISVIALAADDSRTEIYRAPLSSF